MRFRSRKQLESDYEDLRVEWEALCGRVSGLPNDAHMLYIAERREILTAIRDHLLSRGGDA